MGVQDFTKVFLPKRELKKNDLKKSLKNKKVAVDAFAELHRAARGMKESVCLRAPDGMPTSHINTIIGLISMLKENGAYQYWVFDFMDEEKKDGEFHNALKALEVKKRHMQRKNAKSLREDLEARLEKLTIDEKDAVEALNNLSKEEKKERELFSDDESDSESNMEEQKRCLIDAIDKQKKREFVLEKFYIDDLIFILDMFEIPWCMAPRGYEAEQICAAATYDERIIGIKMDYVLSPDADAIVCGAKKVIKRDHRQKKLFEYVLDDLLDENGLELSDLAKIAAILGCDYTKELSSSGEIITVKTKGVGAKTVLKKFRTVELNPIQQKAVDKFLHIFTPDEVDEIDIENAENTPYLNIEKVNQLVDWLVSIKGFNRSRLIPRIKKIVDNFE